MTTKHPTKLEITMRPIITGITALLLCAQQFSSGDDVYVRGHFRRDGSYVQGHHRTSPDHTVRNNWSTWGNTNPYTGSSGYRFRSLVESRESIPTANPSQYATNEIAGTKNRVHSNDVSQTLRDDEGVNSPPIILANGESLHFFCPDGVRVDWPSGFRKKILARKTPIYPKDVESVETRRTLAALIADQGWSVEWKQWTGRQLYEMWSRIDIAKRFEDRGGKIDWRQFDSEELLVINSI